MACEVERERDTEEERGGERDTEEERGGEMARQNGGEERLYCSVLTVLRRPFLAYIFHFYLMPQGSTEFIQI